MRCSDESIHAPAATTATTNTSRNAGTMRPQCRLRRGPFAFGGGGGWCATGAGPRGGLAVGGGGTGRRGGGGRSGGVCGFGGQGWGAGGGRWLGASRVTWHGSLPAL